jgi:tRNA-dihydrouridine synthase 4
MILADVFASSNYARECEFSTNILDDPVVIQFAASNGLDLANAAELAAPFVSGIDINCGCPQKWAINEKIGSHLMSDPETVRDMVRQVKARVDVPCSIKIRIHRDLRYVILVFGRCSLLFMNDFFFWLWRLRANGPIPI